MRIKTHVAVVVLAFTIASCGTDTPQEAGTSENVLQDTTAAATITEVPDTTLQPKVKLVLQATGNTPETMTFNQDTLTIPKDALVELSLQNEGTGMTMIHNFVLTTLGKYEEIAVAGAMVGSPGNYVPTSEHVLAATPLALPGQTVNFEFKAPPPGTYNFVC
ncbi:MAG TPA: azurin, partial [Pontibacter sp.]